MIPAQFEAADDVFPQIVLSSRGEGESSVRIGGIAIAIDEELLLATVAKIFATHMEAKFFGGLIGGVTTDGPGFTAEVIDVEEIERRTQAQTGNGGGNGAADIIVSTCRVIIDFGFIFI